MTRSVCAQASALYLVVFGQVMLSNGGASGGGIAKRRPLHENHGWQRQLSMENVAAALPRKPLGDASCRCLTATELEAKFPLLPEWEAVEKDLGPDFNLSTYGVGCAAHDVKTLQCSVANNCSNVVPLPPDCERSYCGRSFCYVDPLDCGVVNKPSVYLKGRFYSYATCGFMDSFTGMDLLSSLRGKTLQVALNSNSGGWKGAYNIDGSFAVNDYWEGPVVEFVHHAAMVGGFKMSLTRPPEWLREESMNFFGSSSFDYCVYATSLGYIDMCISAYTITDKRASVAAFFETTADPIYLVTNVEATTTTWESFLVAFKTIFQPFTLGSWLMIVLFGLPILGLLMLFHEYGAPGSAYPRTIPSVTLNLQTGAKEYKTMKVSMLKHVMRSLYMAFLAFFQESYQQSIVTRGGKVNLLAISSFVLLVLAVYTANLAAILTSDIASSSVSSIEDAIKKGYNFCSERKVAEIVTDLHKIDPDLIVPDPISLGGDGRPGFNCPNCAARTRVFDHMRSVHNDQSLYCNAAFASWEDLQVLHGRGLHCDKQKVGEALAHQSIGVPLSQDISDALLSLFHQIRNDGVLEKELSAAEPQSSCPVTEGEGNALSVQQLTGIWMISFFFAFVALMTKFGTAFAKKQKWKKPKVQEPLQCYDQWGHPTSHEMEVDGHFYHPDSVRNLQRELSRTLSASWDLMNGQGGQAQQHGTNDASDGSYDDDDATLKTGSTVWPRLRKVKDQDLARIDEVSGHSDSILNLQLALVRTLSASRDLVNGQGGQAEKRVSIDNSDGTSDDHDATINIASKVWPRLRKGKDRDSSRADEVSV